MKAKKKKRIFWLQGMIILFPVAVFALVCSFANADQPNVAQPYIIIIDNPPNPHYDLYVSKSGSGSGNVTSDDFEINCGGDCSASYEVYGQYITLTLSASADPGSVFRGWSGGGCSGSKECVVVVKTSNTQVTALFALSPELSQTEGTIGTQFTITGSDFGTKKGKVLVGDKATKIINWEPSSITGLVNKALPPNDPFYVLLIQKDPKGIVPIILEETFTMMEPVIVSVSPPAEDGTVVISGNYFGTKKGKVYLEYEKEGSPKKKNLKVTSWGMESITFMVPKTSKSFPADSYPLKASNKVGIAEAPLEFTVE